MPSGRAGPLAAFAVVSVVCALVVVANMARHPHATVTAVEAAQVAHLGPEVRFGSVLAPRPRDVPLTGNVLSVALGAAVASTLPAPVPGPAPTTGPARKVARPAARKGSSSTDHRTPRPRPSAPSHPRPSGAPAAPGHSAGAPGHHRGHGHAQPHRPPGHQATVRTGSPSAAASHGAAAPRGRSAMAPGHLARHVHPVHGRQPAHGHGRALGRR